MPKTSSSAANSPKLAAPVPVTAVISPLGTRSSAVADGKVSPPETDPALSTADVQISWRSPVERMAAGSKQLSSVTPEALDLSSDYPLIEQIGQADDASGHHQISDPGSFSHLSDSMIARGIDDVHPQSIRPIGDALSEAAERAFEQEQASPGSRADAASQAAAAIDEMLSEEDLPDIEFLDPDDEFELGEVEVIELDEHDELELAEIEFEEIVFAEPKPLNALPDRGELGHLTSLALFANLVRRKVTGRLALVLEPTRKEIYFINGEPKFVSSNVASERLGEFLRRKGVISEGELSMALVMLPQFDNRLIATLVGLGLLDDSQAIHMMTQQVRAKLVDACGWEKGSYRFTEGEEIPCAWLPLPLDPFEVMGAAALNTTDNFIDGWAAWREERIPQQVNPPPVAIDAFRNGSEITDLLRRLSGRRTLGELRDEASSEKEWRRACRLLLLLTEVGFIRVIRP